LGGYDFGKFIYALPVNTRSYPSPVHWAKELGCLLWYGTTVEPGRRRKTRMDIAKMVVIWKAVFVGLATAHDKDEADKYEASVEDLLVPLLTAPVAQLREFAEELLLDMQKDKSVPFLVWRAFEVYVEQMRKAPDEEVKELKTDLARSIVELVEHDAKADLNEAMMNALQWRSPEKLEEVKQVVEREKAAGKKVRLKGRESCLFLEAGGTVENPEVCIQV